MEAQALHLHTYFLFPFSVDKDVVMQDHQNVWENLVHWIDGLDTWIADHGAGAGSPVAGKLGRWTRDAYRNFDVDSAAYQDMVFFHPFVRRVFFDTADACGIDSARDAQLRCYKIPLEPHLEAGRKVILEAEDSRGRSAAVEVTDLRLLLFANGIGILAMGVESTRIPIRQALWINEMMRKVYPSSGRQVREGRTARRTALAIEDRGGARQVLVEERFEHCQMRGFLPPLSRVITELLYFSNYARQEFEPVLDERMIVYTYLAVDPKSVPERFDQSEDYEILMSRLLYVDRQGDEYRYEADFTREAMRRQVYRRWAHQGTLYGFTSYSNVTLVMGNFDCDEHELREGFLIHRMFTSRYYLMVMVAMFYRATLLDFSERTALVSRALYRNYESAMVTEADIRVATRLLAEFQHFSNYWYFSELANKDEEIEHFQMQCQEHRLEPMKIEVEQEIEKLSMMLDRLFQLHNTEAVNRLAMLSMILGGGAMVTGFFGMNFGRNFSALFFEPARDTWVHLASIWGVTLVAVGSVLFGVYLVATHWPDYRQILLPAKWKKARLESLRKTRDDGDAA